MVAPTSGTWGMQQKNQGSRLERLTWFSMGTQTLSRSLPLQNLATAEHCHRVAGELRRDSINVLSIGLT